jgi:hypothetical protein
MQVQMKYFLSGIGAAVDNGAESIFREAGTPCNFLRGQ